MPSEITQRQTVTIQATRMWTLKNRTKTDSKKMMVARGEGVTNRRELRGTKF